MMKKYIKPELFYERYELSQHIALGCDWMLTNETGENCVANPQKDLPTDYGTLFTDYPRCFNDDDVEQYCYQPGANGEFALFKS